MRQQVVDKEGGGKEWPGARRQMDHADGLPKRPEWDETADQHNEARQQKHRPGGCALNERDFFREDHVHDERLRKQALDEASCEKDPVLRGSSPQR